jgi:hypothetical protein
LISSDFARSGAQDITTEDRGLPGSSGSRCQRAWRCAARRPPLPQALPGTIRAARHPAGSGGRIPSQRADRWA